MKNSAIYFPVIFLFIFTACNTENQRAYKEYLNSISEENQEEVYFDEEVMSNNLDNVANENNVAYNQVSNNSNNSQVVKNDPIANYSSKNQVASSPNNVAVQPPKQIRQTSPKVIMHTIPSTTLPYPFAQMPLPSNWKINTNVKSGEPSISGPNGISVYNYQGANYMYSSDQFMQQSYQAAGQQMRRPTGSANALKNDLTAEFNKLGYKMTKQYPLHQLAQVNKNYDSKLFKSAPSQGKFEVLGSEWTDGKGNTTLLIMNYFETHGQGSVYWGYYLSAIEAPNSEFEQAKNHYVNGLAKIQHNPQNIQAFNQKEAQKSNQSWAAHNQKMANNQASFNASQKRLNDTYNEISDINMKGYNSRNAMQEKGHSNYINSINETQNVYNGTNGQTYNVEAGSNQYWMNSSGEYIQSNDYNYNPNTDPNANQYNWQQVYGNP